MLKFFITTHQHEKLISDLQQNPYSICIHLYKDCKLLLGNTTGVKEQTLTYQPSMKEMSDGFIIKKKEVKCCPECYVKKYPNWFDLIEKENLEEENRLAEEFARKKYGL